MKKVGIMISLLSGNLTILVLWSQITSENSEGFPWAGAWKKGGVGKFSNFLALSDNISKTLADMAKVTIND